MAQLASKLSEMEAYVEKQRMKKWIKKQTRAELSKQKHIQSNLNPTYYTPPRNRYEDGDDDDEEEEETDTEEKDNSDEDEEEEEREHHNLPLQYKTPPVSRYKHMIMKQK